MVADLETELHRGGPRRREFQALRLRAVTERPTSVTWFVDGAPIGTVTGGRLNAAEVTRTVGTYLVRSGDARGVAA